MSYDDFLKGKRPEHIKQLACPMLADQGACDRIPGFIDKCNELNGGTLWGRLISQCRNQKNKFDCWRRFDELQKDIEDKG